MDSTPSAMIIDYPWYALLLCLAAAALYAGLLYFAHRPPFGTRLRWLLAALRFVAVALIAFLLLAPVARQTVHERQLPLVALVQDRSLSVLSSPDSAFSLQPLADRLAGKCRTARFADSTTPGVSNLAAMLDVPPDAAAVVLASDGIHNRGNSPVAAAERLGIPVYTVALGDTTPRRDAAIAHLRANRIALLGNQFPVELTVNAVALAGRSSRLSVVDEAGHALHSETLSFSSDDYSAPVSFTLPADQPGLHRFTAILAPLDGEATTANNTFAFYTDVIDTRQRIAIVANAPHPDIAALKRAIENDPHREVSLFWASDLAGRKSDSLDRCSMVVLHNLPSQLVPDVGFAKALPRLYVIGTQTDLPRFNALHSGLEIISRVNKSNEVTAAAQPGFSLFSLANTEAVELFPPLTAPFGEARLAAGVQSLFNARIGRIVSRQPLIAASAQGPRRQAFIWGEGLWRWRLADFAANGSHEVFDNLVSQLVGFTALPTRRDRLQVDAPRSVDEGEQPLLKAQLYNEAYEPTHDAALTLHLSGDSLAADFSFLRDGDGYRLLLPTLPAGLYRFRAATADGTLSTDGAFAVEASSLEHRRLTADHALLRAVCQASGGQLFFPDQTEELYARLAALKPTIHSHTRYAELLRLPAALLLILLLLGAEWVLRKYHGSL